MGGFYKVFNLELVCTLRESLRKVRLLRIRFPAMSS